MKFNQAFAALLLIMVCGVDAHGWVYSPVSKNEMAFHHYQRGMPDSLRWEPQTSYWGNNAGKMLHGDGYPCGAKEVEQTMGLKKWQAWYDEAKVDVPKITAGGNITLNTQITADHGGQAWFTISCDDQIGPNTTWYYLNRSMEDRGHHFMPSNPEIYAWDTEEAHIKMNDKVSATWDVPKDLNCTDGRVIGRWLWKTGSTCNDCNNIGRQTQKFNLTEFKTVVNAYENHEFVKPPCTDPPETFISCFDFQQTGINPGPPTPPIPSQPKIPTCCWTKWGDDMKCGDYVGHGSLCNTDLTKKCQVDGDCAIKKVPDILLIQD